MTKPTFQVININYHNCSIFTFFMIKFWYTHIFHSKVQFGFSTSKWQISLAGIITNFHWCWNNPKHKSLKQPKSCISYWTVQAKNCIYPFGRTLNCQNPLWRIFQNTFEPESFRRSSSKIQSVYFPEHY